MPASTATRVVEVKRMRPRGSNPGGPASSAYSEAQTKSDPKVNAERASALFAHYVRNNLERPILRYSHRMKLLKQAELLGVKRFEANLVIARVLNEEGMGQEVQWTPDRGGKGWRLPMAAFVVVQAAVAAGVWWVLR